jgi:hypothetical protein
MAQATPVKTPMGVYASASLASRAHECSVATILNRIRIDPENYKRLLMPVPVARPRLPRTTQTITADLWPMTWSQYRVQSFELREEIFNRWIEQTQLDPESESAVAEFFGEMDQMALALAQAELDLAEAESADQLEQAELADLDTEAESQD